MTALYFAEKQLKRYPWRSAAYFVVCFFFAVVIALFGMVSVAMQKTLNALSKEDKMDRVIVYAGSEDVTKETLSVIKNVEQVEEDYDLITITRAFIDFSSVVEESPYVILQRGQEGLPARAKSVYEDKNGKSPIICGRDITSEGEMIVSERLLLEFGFQKADYPNILGKTFVSTVMNYWTREYEEDGSWTIVGVSEKSFSEIDVGIIEENASVAYVRAKSTDIPYAYCVYPQKGMMKSVYRSLAEKYGEDRIYEESRSGEAKQRFLEYISFFDRVFMFLISLLGVAFLGVTVFAVVFYTSKQSEFQMIASAFGARRGALFLSQTLCYALLLLPAVLLSILTSALLQGAFLDVLGGYLGATLVRVSVGMLFAVGGMIFGVLALCVAAGVVIGTVAVQKRNL